VCCCGRMQNVNTRRLRALFTITSIAILVGNVGCASTNELEDSEDDLIGGFESPQGKFLSTLQVVGNCTVTKVGPNLLLTAAHCVRDSSGTIQRAFEPNAVLQLRVRQKSGPEVDRVATIVRTELHPQIAQLCRIRGCTSMASQDIRDAPDLAVIQVASGLANIPTAKIDTVEAKPGDAVNILGYGCTGSVNGPSDGLLRYRETVTSSVDVAIHQGSSLGSSNSAGKQTVEANYVITPGPQQAVVGANSAGLCPGDSGGALYRKGRNVVVGVNASYTFLPNGDRPVTNWHARVDGKSRWGTARWLEQMGAKLTSACTEATCLPSRSAVP
jgi:hypothetical protein